MPNQTFEGILFRSDPHLASRTVGFRKDDFGRTILRKLNWCLDYADRNGLLPVILGDLFHHPRDNANWLLGELLETLARHKVIGIYGNHDCREDRLTDDDSLDVLVSAGHYRMIGIDDPWRGIICGQNVVIFGISWRPPIPASVPRMAADQYAVMLTHHDLSMPGYEEVGYIRTREIPGVDLVVNGHLHRRLEEQTVGKTTWVNPGNITRISRSDASRSFVPQVLKSTFEDGEWKRSFVEVPHEDFAAVFHEEISDVDVNGNRSEFVKGLAELQSRRTDSGAGLKQFLDLNLPRFPTDIRSEIESLAAVVLNEGPERVGETL